MLDDSDWISISPASGQAGYTDVTITVAANEDYEPRQGRI